MKKCPKCGKEYDDNFKFCQKDGTQLSESLETHCCPKCGKPNELNAKFCSSCDHKLIFIVYKCLKCGLEISKSEKFCTKCGEKIVQQSNGEDQAIVEEEERIMYFNQIGVPFVKIPNKDILMSTIPVTRKIYAIAMDDSSFVIDNHYPAAMEYRKAICLCNKLSALFGLDSCYFYKDTGNTDLWSEDYWSCDMKNIVFKKRNGFYIPSQEVWKYAATANNKFKFSGSDDINDVAWYASNSDGKIHESALKKPNDFGLYDMSGNIGEWTFNGNYYGGDYTSESDKCTIESSQSSLKAKEAVRLIISSNLDYGKMDDISAKLENTWNNLVKKNEEDMAKEKRKILESMMTLFEQRLSKLKEEEAIEKKLNDIFIEVKNILANPVNSIHIGKILKTCQKFDTKGLVDRTELDYAIKILEQLKVDVVKREKTQNNAEKLKKEKEVATKNQKFKRRIHERSQAAWKNKAMKEAVLLASLEQCVGTLEAAEAFLIKAEYFNDDRDSDASAIAEKAKRFLKDVWEEIESKFENIDFSSFIDSEDDNEESDNNKVIIDLQEALKLAISKISEYNKKKFTNKLVNRIGEASVKVKKHLVHRSKGLTKLIDRIMGIYKIVIKCVTKKKSKDDADELERIFEKIAEYGNNIKDFCEEIK